MYFDVSLLYLYLFIFYVDLFRCFSIICCFIYRRLGGIIGSADPNWEIGFGFVSCSCRACVRAGEAKLRERMRGTCLLNAGEENTKMFSGGSGGVGFRLFMFPGKNLGF